MRIFHHHNCRRNPFVFHSTLLSSSSIHPKLLHYVSVSCSPLQENNIPIHHSACQGLLWEPVFSTRLLGFSPATLCTFRFAVPTLYFKMWIARLPSPNRCEIARALALSVQSSRLCGSLVGPSSNVLSCEMIIAQFLLPKNIMRLPSTEL